MKIGWLPALLVVLLPVFAPAQEATPTPAQGQRKPITWRADMQAGEYFVLLRSITSISMHEYVVDGTAQVSEVTIATTGSEIARFYFIAPLQPKMPGGIGQSGVDMINDKVKDLQDRAGAGDWQKVVKNYPISTHAHTVEYRVESKDILNKLFKSVRQAWLDDREDTFKP